MRRRKEVPHQYYFLARAYSVFPADDEGGVNVVCFARKKWHNKKQQIFPFWPRVIRNWRARAAGGNKTIIHSAGCLVFLVSVISSLGAGNGDSVLPSPSAQLSRVILFSFLFFARYMLIFRLNLLLKLLLPGYVNNVYLSLLNLLLPFILIKATFFFYSPLNIIPSDYVYPYVFFQLGVFQLLFSFFFFFVFVLGFFSRELVIQPFAVYIANVLQLRSAVSL